MFEIQSKKKECREHYKQSRKSCETGKKKQNKNFFFYNAGATICFLVQGKSIDFR